MDEETSRIGATRPGNRFQDALTALPVEAVGPRPSTAPRRNFRQVIRDLHESEINAGL